MWGVAVSTGEEHQALNAHMTRLVAHTNTWCHVTSTGGGSRENAGRHKPCGSDLWRLGFCPQHTADLPVL